MNLSSFTARDHTICMKQRHSENDVSHTGNRFSIFDQSLSCCFLSHDYYTRALMEIIDWTLVALLRKENLLPRTKPSSSQKARLYVSFGLRQTWRSRIIPALDRQPPEVIHLVEDPSSSSWRLGLLSPLGCLLALSLGLHCPTQPLFRPFQSLYAGTRYS